MGRMPDPRDGIIDGSGSLAKEVTEAVPADDLECQFADAPLLVAERELGLRVSSLPADEPATACDDLLPAAASALALDALPRRHPPS